MFQEVSHELDMAYGMLGSLFRSGMFIQSKCIFLLSTSYAICLHI